jgi:lipopolysaccharide transport system ATP-binding protein
MPVISVENLSKQYRLGDIGTGTLMDDFKRFQYRLMGKEDPFLKVGLKNEPQKKSDSKYVWALNGLNFQIEQGQVMGVIGGNGAGKSTLLKILSRITAPTLGHVRIKGRIASLLEIGTGFHPDLSGRENIYLNGAIMGLRKWQIDERLDEIIDFGGVEQYLDTPVKRYSSGMYVRLAFAVAAHLEPDILIVDEVLAVGDVEFQQKCLGKMKNSSSEKGRTILFVSHNMESIKQLCDVGIYLENGQLNQIGKVDEVIAHYNANTIKKNLVIPK